MNTEPNLAILFALCVLFALRQGVSAFLLRASPRSPAQRLGGNDVLCFLWVGYLILIGLALFDATREGMTASRYVQLFVLMCGSLLRTAALAEIWPYYWPGVALFNGQRIVREGPYRVFAHPLYLGLALETIALAAMSGRPAAGILATLLVVSMQVQVRREEVALERRFRGTYRAYRAVTFDIGDVLPRPWSAGRRTGEHAQPIPPLPRSFWLRVGEAESRYAAMRAKKLSGLRVRLRLTA